MILTTPTKMHFRQGEQVMRAGKHVLVEIPVTDCVEDAENLVKIAKETGVTAMGGHVRRFNPSHQYVHKKIKAGELKIQQMDVQTYFFRRKNINAAGNPRSWTDHLLWHHAAHTIDLFQYQCGENISDCYAVQGPIHPQLNIAMDMGIVAKTPSGAILTLSLSFNNDGPLGSFFRYICDNGTYKAFYDDLSDGKDNKIDVSKVDVSMDGIELEDREFIAAIKEKREPNGSLAAAAALHARARQAREDHRPAAQGARVAAERRHSALMPPAFRTFAHFSTSLVDQLGERLGRQRARLGAEILQPLPQPGIAQSRVDLIVELGKDVGRDVARCADPEERIRFEALHGIADRRHIGQIRRACRGCDAERTQPAVLDLIDLRVEVVEHDVDLALHQRDRRRPGAAIGHVLHLHAGHLLEQFARDVNRGTQPAGGVVDLAGIGLGVGYELGDGLGGHAGMHGHDVGHGCQRSDVLKVLDHVEVEVVVERRVNRVVRAEQEQRVAVRRRAHHGFGAETAGLAGLGFDDELLARPLRQPARDDAGEDVLAAARRKADHDLDGAVRISALGENGRCREQATQLKSQIAGNGGDEIFMAFPPQGFYFLRQYARLQCGATRQWASASRPLASNSTSATHPDAGPHQGRRLCARSDHQLELTSLNLGTEIAARGTPAT